MSWYIYEDCIQPTRLGAPWALPVLAVLLCVMPLVGIGVGYLGKLFMMHNAIPPFLFPLVIIMTFIVSICFIGVLVALGLTIVTISTFTTDARRARLARNALGRETRCRRSRRILALNIRLATVRQGGPGEGSWSEAWQKVAKARSSLKLEVLHDRLDLGGNISRCASPWIVLVMWVLIGLGQYAFFTLVLPWYRLGRFWSTAVLIPTGLMAVRMFYDYVCVLLKSPGYTESSLVDNKVDSIKPPSSKECEEQGRWCKRCSNWKPPRCHHCRICRRCVLRMDHHCMFVNNCVGQGNYRHFVLLLVDIIVGCVVLVACLIPQIGRIFDLNNDATSTDRSVMFISGLVGLAGMCILTPFLWYHVQMILSNETTLERLKRESAEKGAKYRKDDAKAETLACYNRGPLQNFAEIFGMPPDCCHNTLESVFRCLAPRRVVKRKD